MRPRSMKFGLHRVSIWVNIKKKFQVPRLHSIGEKCDDKFKFSSHFSRKLCDRETWNLDCIEYPYGLIYKKNFKFLGRTVSEKSAMLISSYHRIFLQNCATEKHEIWFPYIQKKFQVPRFNSIGEKCNDNFKLSSHFSPKLCDRGTWNLVCIEYPYWLIYKKDFKFLIRTV